MESGEADCAVEFVKSKGKSVDDMTERTITQFISPSRSYNDIERMLAQLGIE